MNTEVIVIELCLVLSVALVVGLYLLEVTYLEPRRKKRAFDRLLQDAKAGKKPKSSPPQFVIQFDSEGFSVRAVKEATNRDTMRWMEIEKVVVFKRDLFAVDMICMLLSKEDGTGIELDEEMGGWLQFAESLPKHLAGCQSHGQWFTEVAFPAFETKLTEIFRRNVTTKTATAC